MVEDLDIPSLAIAGMERAADLEEAMVVHNNSTTMALADTTTMKEVQLDNTMAAIQVALADTEVDYVEQHLAFDIATAM